MKLRSNHLYPFWFAFSIAILSGFRLSCQTPFACKGQIFLSLGGSPHSLSEITFDPFLDTVLLSYLNPDAGVNLNALGFRITDRLIYGWDDQSQRLFRVDANGAIEFLAIIPFDANLDYFGGDVSPDGKYLVLIGGGDPDYIDRKLAIVDLTSPFFDHYEFPLHGAGTRCFDIAFDPISGKLFGFDVYDSRLVSIDLTSGEIQTPYPAVANVSVIGGLFFDPFGNLFGYGGTNGAAKNTLFSIDKNTGAVSVVAKGHSAGGTDGCACPYTVDIQKTVSPDSVAPCGKVKYVFSIANSSQMPVENVNFTDLLPNGFTITSLLRNPFGGMLESGTGSNLLHLSGLKIPPGRDSIEMEVTVGEIPEGIYLNQSALTNLPEFLGKTRLSGNPDFPLSKQATALTVLPGTCDSLPTGRPSVYAPNAFSPNGDGINEHFFLQTKEPLHIRKLSIFSRWGELVFQAEHVFTNDWKAGWDGTFEGKTMNPGIFTWFAELELSNGERWQEQGSMALIL